MSNVAILGITWAASALVMLCFYFVAIRRRSVDFLGVGRAVALAIATLLLCSTLNGFPERKYLIATLVLLWAVRLAGHLLYFRCNATNREIRFRQLCAAWGSDTERKLFLLFQMHALLCVVLSLPVLVVMSNQVPCFTVWDTIAVGLWVFAVGGVAISDLQLDLSQKNLSGSGQVCTVGLWRYSRHPNYFFEWLHWTAYAVLAVGTAQWWMAFLTIWVVLYLLLQVTGIPPSEEQALAMYGDEYRNYQRRTSAFVPWFPRAEETRAEE